MPERKFNADPGNQRPEGIQGLVTGAQEIFEQFKIGLFAGWSELTATYHVISAWNDLQKDGVTSEKIQKLIDNLQKYLEQISRNNQLERTQSLDDAKRILLADQDDIQTIPSNQAAGKQSAIDFFQYVINTTELIRRNFDGNLKRAKEAFLLPSAYEYFKDVTGQPRNFRKLEAKAQIARTAIDLLESQPTDPSPHSPL